MIQFGDFRHAILKAVLLTAALTFAPAAQAQSDFSIVPGERIGPARLGMTEAQIYSLLGDPVSTVANGPYTMAYFYPGFIINVSDKTHVVTTVSTADSRYSTAEGIKVGSSCLMIAAKLGALPGGCRAGFDYPYANGLGLQTGPDGNIFSIYIMPAAGHRY